VFAKKSVPMIATRRLMLRAAGNTSSAACRFHPHPILREPHGKAVDQTNRITLCRRFGTHHARFPAVDFGGSNELKGPFPTAVCTVSGTFGTIRPSLTRPSLESEPVRTRSQPNMKSSILRGTALTSLAIGIFAASSVSSAHGAFVNTPFQQGNPFTTFEKPTELPLIPPPTAKAGANRIPEPAGALVIGLGVISFFHRLRRTV